VNGSGEHIVKVNGVELCVEAFGDPGDPAILLIHGVGSTMLSWDEELCARLAAGDRFVIRYDWRDAGRSVTYAAGAPPYTQLDLVADAVALLDFFGIARAHLVGMSVGGSIAQLVALDHPDRVVSLTLASTTPGIPGEETSDLPPPTGDLPMPPEPDWSDRAAVVDYLVACERPYSPRFDELAARKLAERVADRSRDIAASTNAFLVDSAGPWRARLGDIAAPTLVVHGTDDPLFPFAHAEALAREIPGAELLALEDTGHEYFPPHTWDIVVPAVRATTSREPTGRSRRDP
jgi:pimeloyl-ACP methyl ester carboxylesterase